MIARNKSSAAEVRASKRTGALAMRKVDDTGDAPMRTYQVVSNEKREQIVDLIEKNHSYRQVAELLKIKYANVRRIYRIYRLENRVQKDFSGIKGKNHKIALERERL